MLTPIISVVLLAISIAAALHALLTKRDSKSALAWVSFCLVIPLLGPLIYLIFGINRITTKAQKLFLATSQTDDSETIKEPEGTSFRPLSLVGESVTKLGLRSSSNLEILENGEALYPKMLESINSAKHRVYLCTYIFQNDETGDQFVRALLAAQFRGLDVRVIVDGLGEFAYPPRIGKKLRKNGINYKLFNPIRFVPPSLHINMRNHRKIMVVDGDVAFTGGQNVSDRHLISKADNTIPTMDLHFKINGKIVDDFERAFLKDWHQCPDIAEKFGYEPSNTNDPDARIWTRLILDGPNENLDKLNEVLTGVLSSARTRIWIMTPYFLPGLDILGALVGAKLRGVDVRILLPERTNIHLAHWAAQHNLHHILSKGLRIFSQPAPFIHTKAIIIDDEYSLVGSANLDARSLRLNFELGLEVFSEDINQQLAEYFLRRLETAHEICDKDLSKLAAWIRLRDAMAWLFSPYL